MKVLVAIIVAVVVMTVIGAAVKFGLPMAWFFLAQGSVSPAEKAVYLNGLFQAAWVLSIAYGLSGFIGAWVFSAMGHISNFGYVALFAFVVSAPGVFESSSYAEGSVVAITGLIFSMLGGYIGLKNPPNQSLKSGTPEAGAP